LFARPGLAGYSTQISVLITIKQCLVALAAKPSFHKGDIDWGMRMAKSEHLYADWSPRQKWAAYELIKRHKAELMAYGYDIANVPVPVNPEVAKPLVPADVRSTLVKSVGRRRVQMIASGHYTVEFPYDAIVTEEIKKLPNRYRVWKSKNQWWEVKFYVNAIDGQALLEFNSFLSRNRFVGPPLVKADVQFLVALAVKQQSDREQALKQSYATDAFIDIPGLGGELRGFQKAGVRYAIEKKRCFIADEMGLGKTPQSMAVIEHENSYPALIVTKAALRGNWMRELQKWLPNRKITRDVDDMEYRVMQVLVISYEAASKWYDKLEGIDWQAIILDESQCIKNNKAKRTRACKDLAKFAKPPVRLCLTGTPIDICPYEFSPQLVFLDRMKDIGGSDYFYSHFCNNDTRGAANLEELNALLRKTCYIRREKKDVLLELPPKQRTFVPMTIDNMPEYRQAEQNLITWLRAEVARRPEAFTVDPEDVDQDDSVEAKQDFAERKAGAAEHLVKVNALKRVALRGMLEGAKEWIETFLESGEKLVVWCHHIEAQQQVYSMFKDIAVWTRASQGPDWAVSQFQTNPKIKVCVCSLKADHAGHTLTAASNQVFLERGWTSTLHDQAEDRLHRIGQRDSVTCWYLQAIGTIYEKIDALIDSRRSLVSAATNGTPYHQARTSVFRDLIRQIAV